MTTKLLETLTLAEEALDMVVSCGYGKSRERVENSKALAAIRDAKAELEEQAEQRPVAIKRHKFTSEDLAIISKTFDDAIAANPELQTYFESVMRHVKQLAAPVQQAEQEPVAWIKLNEDGVYIEDVTGFPVYAAPVRTKDLTDDEIDAVYEEWGAIPYTAAIRAVIAADRRKNK